MPRSPFETQFEALTENLLRGGIAPKHVSRYIRELSDHYDDLVNEARKSGVPTFEAEREALTRIGSAEELAKAMLARDDLKSWGVRYPVAYYSLGPVLSLLSAFGIVVTALVIIMITLKVMIGPNVAFEARWLETPFDVLSLIVKYVLPLIVGAVFVAQATRQRTDVRWVFMGIVLISAVGGASDMGLVWPQELGQKGELQFGFGFFPPFPDLNNSLFRMALNIALLTPALWWLSRADRPSQKI